LAREGNQAIERNEAAASRSGRLMELYQLNARDGVRLAYLMTGDRELAEDISQEAFIRVAGKWQDLRKPEAFRSYLRRSIVNLSRSHFRRQRVARNYLRRQPSTEASTALPDLERREALRLALQSLPHRQRAALVLRYYQDLSEQQTADALGCSVAAVKSLVTRGTSALRQRIEEGT
jgi:RNA polymerase sigma-70 factor (sigma-E family)